MWLPIYCTFHLRISFALDFVGNCEKAKQKKEREKLFFLHHLFGTYNKEREREKESISPVFFFINTV